MVIIDATHQLPARGQRPDAGYITLLNARVYARWQDKKGRVGQATIAKREIEQVIAVALIAQRQAALVQFLAILVPLKVGIEAPEIAETEREFANIGGLVG